MATTRIGINVPDDLDREAGAVYSVSLSTIEPDGDDLEWEAELFECTDGIGALIGTNGSTGLVTWWRTGSLDEGMAWIDEQLDARESDD
jgi:hypothetical protein